MVKIWLESHCTTIDNEAKRASGWNDIDLSEKGRQQSLELVDRCRSRNLSAIFCSDLQRAVKSGVPTASELHLPLFPDKRLRECNYGDFTLKAKKVVELERPKRIKVPFPNGESYQQCMKRMKNFLEWLEENYDNKTVMIIGHRATHCALEHFIKRKSLELCLSEQIQRQPGWLYEL